MDSNDKYIGRILDNRYEILELIGTGGMALVYKARCHRLNRMVAIKILKEDLASDEEFQRRFYTESQAVAMLSHPNIVAVYDVSRSGNIEYIVMELIEGITLKQYINRKGLLNWKEVLHFATQITKALSHAHSRGIIHRDIKPHNIMILKDGSVKVADFGIARLLSVQNTLTQEALGSVHYISPEQAKGGHVDARSDIYSVGVVMYEMLTSRLPFVGESAVSVAIQHISAIPLMPRDINPDIPAGLEDITMHAMEPDLSLRFTTADEMLNDLEDFRKNPSILFNYAMSAPDNRQSPDMEEYQETRVIHRGAIINQDGLPAKVERVATPATQAKRRTPVKAEMSSDEYRAVKKRANNTSTLIGIFSIVVFLIAVVVFMWNYLLKGIFVPEYREQITIPRFINRKIDDILSNEEFNEQYSFNVSYENNDEYSDGIVFYQNPMPERQQSALPGRKINVELVVSSGEEPPHIMPNLLGLHYADAKNQLISLNLDLDIVEESVTSDVERGYVVETRPDAEGKISRGNTVVIVRSAGPDKRMEKVPDIIGSSREALESAFRDLDLTPDFKVIAGNEPEGTVLIISKAGQEVEVPATITVYISQGPPEITPPETEDPSTVDPGTITPPVDDPGLITPPVDDPGTETPPPEQPGPDNPPPEQPGPDNPPPDENGFVGQPTDVT